MKKEDLQKMTRRPFLESAGVVENGGDGGERG